MRVLQVNSVCGRGSTGRIVVALHDALRGSGDECRVVYGRGDHDPSVDATRIDSTLSVGIHVGLARLTDRQGFYSRRATERLLEEIRRYSPEVIHLHNLHGYYLHLPTLFGYLQSAEIPVVWTLHDCWPFTGHCAYFDFVGCEKWRSECHKCPQKTSYPASYVADRSNRNFEQKKSLYSKMGNMTIVTPSRWLADLVGQSILNTNPVQVIGNGVDQNLFRPRPSALRERYGVGQRFMVLGVASPWSARKGLQDFVRVADLLGPRFAIVLVGVDEGMAKRLPASIICLPRTQNVGELARIYTAADVFFNPTYEDNFPTTNLEANACGTPVITYNVGGSPETVAATAGYVVPAGDVSAAAEIMAALARSPKQKFIPSSSFNAHHMQSGYLRLYQRITG